MPKISKIFLGTDPASAGHTDYTVVLYEGYEDRLKVTRTAGGLDGIIGTNVGA